MPFCRYDDDTAGEDTAGVSAKGRAGARAKSPGRIRIRGHTERSGFSFRVDGGRGGPESRAAPVFRRTISIVPGACVRCDRRGKKKQKIQEGENSAQCRA